jgi:flagellar basal body-associated protein FliL
MADEKEENKEEIGGKEATSGKKGGLVGWIITFAVAIICATGGYGLSGLFAKNETKAPEGTVDGGGAEEGPDFTSADPDAAKPWTFELETIIANLNELGSTRIIQITVVIELYPEMDQTKG